MNPYFRIARWFLPVFAVVLLGQGCLGGGQPAGGPDGGVFRSVNDETWTQLTVLSQGETIGSIANVGIVSIAADPQDPNALYAGTTENGILYSLDGGASWINPPAFRAGRVAALAVHPKNKCTVYAVRANQILKTENCHRDWMEIFFNPRTDNQFTSLVIDWFNPSTLYAATDGGDILKSNNNGQTWGVVHRVEGIRINNLAMDYRDSRVIYASTFGQGVLKTTDGGANWTRIRDELNEFDGARRTVLVALDPNNPSRVYHVSKYGILLSEDGGAAWRSLPLPSPANTVDLRAFAVHPNDGRRLVYATDQSVVFSVDGGQTWTSRQLPTTRRPSVLTYVNDNPPELYLGATQAAR